MAYSFVSFSIAYFFRTFVPLQLETLRACMYVSFQLMSFQLIFPTVCHSDTCLSKMCLCIRYGILYGIGMAYHKIVRTPRLFLHSCTISSRAPGLIQPSASCCMPRPVMQCQVTYCMTSHTPCTDEISISYVNRHKTSLVIIYMCLEVYCYKCIC